MPRRRTHADWPDHAADATRPWWGVWLSRAAFITAAALILARATMLETLRNPLDVQPGAEPVPRGPGAGTGLVLDLLGCLPALLALARRAFDPSFALRFAWSFVPMAILAVWTVVSAAWAGDRFAAAVSGTHWLCACVLLWSMTQVVTDWLSLRLVAALCVGLLLVQAGQGLYYRFVEHPELVGAFKSQRDEIIRQRGWELDSFVARQFEKRVLSGEMMGFTSSPNSYAAVLVLLTFVTGGIALQRLADRDGFAWAAAPGGTAVLAALVIAFVGSRTAIATTFLGAVALAAMAVLRRALEKHSRVAFGAGVAGVVVAGAAVVGHGLYHGTLFQDSLTFRWRYWVAAARLFAAHPLAGVGWDNFGAHYLAYRLPVAAEEIKDPHNFLVRFATELGAVGLALVVVWLLALWWELTQGSVPEVASQRKRDELASAPAGAAASPLSTIAAIGVLGTVINVMTSIDWYQPPSYNALEVMRRVGFLCLFVIGASLAALRSAERQEADDRPGPWVLYGILLALGLFFLHNLVDFSLFEPGPMFLFAWVCGAALGIRAAGSAVQRRVGRVRVLAALVALFLAWVIALGGFAAPVVIAEGHADEGDEALRTLRFRQATYHFEQALRCVGYNADYAFRAAGAGLANRNAANPREPIELLSRAISLDPNRPQYWLHRAYARLRLPSPDAQAVRADYQHALRLDPNNVDVRIEYGETLRRFGDRAAAAAQYREALRYNDLLNPDEPKRLPQRKVDEIGRAIAELDPAAGR